MSFSVFKNYAFPPKKPCFFRKKKSSPPKLPILRLCSNLACLFIVTFSRFILHCFLNICPPSHFFLEKKTLFLRKNFPSKLPMLRFRSYLACLFIVTFPRSILHRSLNICPPPSQFFFFFEKKNSPKMSL